MGAKKAQSSRKMHNSFAPSKYVPASDNQCIAYDSWNEGKHLLLHGMAGTGKTYTALALAFDAVFNKCDQQQIIVFRSAVPTRDMGFMPGNENEKARHYEEPYAESAIKIFNRGDAYGILKDKGYLEFRTTSFVRGITLDDSVVIVDESQSMTAHELDSLITRAGINTRFIFCGDTRQSDLVKQSDRTGFPQFMGILEHVESFAHIEFGIDDIRRSGLVRDYIIAREENGGYR